MKCLIKVTVIILTITIQACSFSLLDVEESKITCPTVSPMKPLSSFSNIEIKAGSSVLNNTTNKQGLILLQEYDSAQRAISKIWLK